MPSSNQIANLVLIKGLPLDNLKSVLVKYNALSMLPNILKKLEGKIKLNNPTSTLEIAAALDTQVLEDLKFKVFKNKDEIVKVTINKELLAGFKSNQNYKSIDASIARIINQIRN